MAVADYYIIIVALWSYAYMIIYMHTYVVHMELMSGHCQRVVTSTGTWSCMRGWHRPTLYSQMELHHGIYTFHAISRLWNSRLLIL
jgi:hypothetical protein